MGRKRRPFIDKKNARTFHLVSRSQQDPLWGEAGEAQGVLKPAEPQSREGRLQEQQKFGVFFEDDYDYLQHLREPGTAVLEPAEKPGVKPPLSLPPELFGSEVTVEGTLTKVLPVSGPQPDWDPDIVAALDSAEVTSDPENQLEDDFVFKANGGEPGLPVYVSEGYDSDDVGGGLPWWQERGDFHPPVGATGGRDSDQSDSAERSHDQSGDQSDCSEGEEEEDSGAMPEFTERKSARFTEYSLSSAVVPRNDALTLLDERFEELMVGYDDSLIGAPEEEEGDSPSRDHRLLDYAVQDFQRNFSHKMRISDSEERNESDSDTSCSAEDEEIRQHDDKSRTAEDAVLTVRESGHTSHESRTAEEGGSANGVSLSTERFEGGRYSSGSVQSGSDGEEGRSESGEEVLVEVGGGKREGWDCESILSTYSTLYNHPTKITEPRPIKLSQKTGIPLGTVPGHTPRETHPKQIPVARVRGESGGERRARKQAVKEGRRQRRAEKKATKLAFKSEQLRQEKTLVNQTHKTAVV